MKLVTWNVNSLNVRLPRLLDWLATNTPDVVCLQETKLEDAKFPVAALDAAGYASHYTGQKTYNGVAILARHGLEVSDVAAGVDGFVDEQKRLLAATVAGVRVISAYVPNGQSVDSDKYRYKLAWCDAVAKHLHQTLNDHPALAIAGDFNVAPEDRDVHDPKRWAGQIHVSEPERAAMRKVIAEAGLTDAFRLFEQPEKQFSWWDYRLAAFQRNWGLRIDHILLSPALAERCSACTIDKSTRGLERPSDHAPVIAELR